MQFNSLVFLAFFAAVLLVHNLRLPWSFRKANLLWFSYVFYAAWNPPFVVLLWLSTIVDWYVGKWLDRTEGKAQRRWLLLLSLVVNLGMLCYFKYGNFLVENFALLTRALGVEWQPAGFDIVLPVGISFYTFQTLSYTLDIYARRTRPSRSFLDYALFVTFFPQLVAGPIVRSREFLPQCVEAPRVGGKQFAWGLTLFVIGLFEKVFLADGVLAPGVEEIFDGAAPPGSLDGWIGCFGFLSQVYCDFSGYSLCAIGIASCLGFRLPMNFRFPFGSVGYKDFWRRWHISLSSWLRDYVYGSLRGAIAEQTAARWTFNILFTWSLIGLWHGSAWRFVLWGVATGILRVLEELLRWRIPKSPFWSTIPVQFCLAFATFTGMNLTMIVFRAPVMSRFFEIVRAMFTGGQGQGTLLSTNLALLTGGTPIVLFLCHWFMRNSSLERLAARCPWFVKTAAIAVMLALIVLSRNPDRAFIYFQF